MCGIAGYFRDAAPASEATVRQMCARMSHRGPDDEGVRVDGGCGIGMRRLSIIDLNTGHQPISNEDGTVWVVFNGEIYNYGELRDFLSSKGHRFTTSSDTEVLVHLYEEEGEAGVARLRGMFAYCIWDAPRRKLFLARDRFGKKPLYYTLLPDGGIAFASELKCLEPVGFPRELDVEAIRLYLQFLYIPDPYSPFRAVRKLPAGSWLTYEAGGRVRQERYWRLPRPSEEPARADEARLAERLREEFDEAVRIRLMADVPLGAFLSGGIDSSSVVASMALQTSEPVKTFSIGFEESEFNELPYARMVAEKYRTDHHEIVVRPDSVSLVERLVAHFDEPFGDSSAIPTFIVSEFAARYVKVALSGDGGDELFAGYDSFRDVEMSRKFDRIPSPVRNALAHTAEALPYSAYGKNYLRMISRPTSLDRYLDHNSVPYFVRRRLLRPEWRSSGSDAERLQRLLPDCFLPADADILSQALFFEGTAKLTGDMLVKVDRMSMANSLEVRCPLLDHKLAELAASIPPGYKLRNGRGKAILVNALASRLPPALLDRPKMGFGVPLAAWFRGSLRGFLHDHLRSSEFLGRGIVHEPFLGALLDEHDSGRRNHYHLLWALLMLELWFRAWAPAAAPAPLENALA